MSFEFRTKVRFADVDPAGIVFYPRYFEMLNAAVEDWFAQSLGADFATLHMEQRVGVPTVKLECEFLAPSMLGDELSIFIRPTRLGRSSCAVTYSVVGRETERLVATAVLVCMDLDAQKSIAWPEHIKTRLEAQLAT
jgi:4-hydroxybenzoyl-CoA thioesterase